LVGPQKVLRGPPVEKHCSRAAVLNRRALEDCKRVVEDFQTGRGLTLFYYEFTQITQEILNCGSWNFFFKNTGRKAIWVEKHCGSQRRKLGGTLF